MRAAFAGGGSGGHLTPVLSVSRALAALDPAGESCFFVTADGLEREVLERAGSPVEVVAAARANRRSTLRFPFALVRGVWQARRALRRRRPHVVVGGGGFVTVPVLLAARLAGIPSVLLEQNTVPGRANRMLSRFARFVITSFPETEGFPPTTDLRCLGNPLRFRREDFPPRRRDGVFHLLVTGGGQGARAINDVVAAAVDRLFEAGVGRITHVCGKLDHPRLVEAARRHGERVSLHPYVDDMGRRMAEADLVLSRAGATTLAELVELGLPAVLVPIPTSVYDHQRKNAAVLARAGGAVLLEQASLDADGLVRTVGEIVRTEGRLAAMSAALEGLRRPRAAEDIAALLLEDFDEGGPR